jgi:hypothetical protein
LKNFLNFLYLFFASLTIKGQIARANAFALEKRTLLLQPGQVLSLEEKNITYAEISNLLKRTGDARDSKNKITLHSESTKVDFSFLDDISITVSIEKQFFAPPNAESLEN